MCRLKELGGLRIGKTYFKNSVLLGRWLWRFPKESCGFWHRAIMSIYGTHCNGWDSNILVRWSHKCPWKAITQVFHEFASHTRFVVGNGERIQLWEDLWWEVNLYVLNFQNFIELSKWQISPSQPSYVIPNQLLGILTSTTISLIPKLICLKDSCLHSPQCTCLLLPQIQGHCLCPLVYSQ